MRCSVLGDVPRLDILNLLPASHCGTILVLDDVPGSVPVRAAWMQLIRDGAIQELECAMHTVWQTYASDGPMARGWCIGQYKNRPCRELNSPMAEQLAQQWQPTAVPPQ